MSAGKRTARQPSDEQIIELLANILARDMTAEARADLADALAKLATRKGSADQQAFVLFRLQVAARTRSTVRASAEILEMPPRPAATTPRREDYTTAVRVQAINGDWGLFEPLP